MVDDRMPISPGAAGQDPKLAVYALSLVRAHARRSHIRTHMRELGLEGTVIDAVGTADLDQTERSCATSPTTYAVMGRALGLEEIACALTHQCAYQRLLASEAEAALVLEDDAELSQDALAIIAGWRSFPENWDVVLLGHSGSTGSRRPELGAEASLWGRRKLTKPYKLVRFVEIAWGGFAYLVSRQGAAKLQAAAAPIRMVADRLTGDPKFAGLALYGVRPVCAGVAEFPSTISEGRDRVVPPPPGGRFRQRFGRFKLRRRLRVLGTRALKLAPPIEWTLRKW